MTAEQRSVKLAISYFEDFDISSEEQKYHALKVRVLSAITEAVAEERERCAKVASKYAGGLLVGQEIAIEIRKKVKP